MIEKIFEQFWVVIRRARRHGFEVSYEITVEKNGEKRTLISADRPVETRTASGGESE